MSMRISVLGSQVPGREPLVSQLATFELALNDSDGKIFYVNSSVPGGEVRFFIDLQTLKNIVAASADFADFKVRLGAL